LKLPPPRYTVDSMPGRAVNLSLILISLALLGVLSGCAYNWGTSERSLPGGYRQIAIPIFVNRTPEVGVEVPFTNAMVREFEQSKIAEVVPLEAAPLRLEGYIEDIKYEVRSSGTHEEIAALPDKTVLATSYRMLVTARLRLRRASDQAILWEGTVKNEKVYPAPRIGSPVVNSANVLYNHSARQLNISSLANDMMEEAHDRMTENF
jgi:hypothetical protein